MPIYRCYHCNTPTPAPDAEAQAAWDQGNTETPGLCASCAGEES